ncbi:MAG: aspartate aminotransferase [Gammaproteobacteria bacterium RIFCSPHIGHO2_12_FULL_37_34]|nr:MAG: aspartate aminotransferase [Gammaproteobacteria bacterium RIFCSPHIGHO2_12_FULL_37_34]
MITNTTQEIAERARRIKASPTLALSARANELQAAGNSIINLTIGEPDFDTPSHIKEAAIKAIYDGQTKYTAVDGTTGLKKAVVDKFLRENRLKYELNQILVSCGAKHSLYNLFSVVLNAGDEVIIPAPYWVSYPDMVMLTDGKPVFIEAGLDQHFKITALQLEAAIHSKTRMIVLNSPSNPSGMAYSAKELKALAEVIMRHPHIIVVSDDIYEHHLWNHAPFTSILNVCPELADRALLVNSTSKTYAMTGWRIGYAAGPAYLISAMKNVQSQNTSSPTTVSQFAAQAALEGNQDCVGIMTKAYKERHDFVVGELQNMPGIACLPSDGTFYTLPSVKELLNKKKGVTNDFEFAEWLLQQTGIATVPGSAFGAPGHIRICYTTSMQNLTEAMKRLHQVVAEF